MAVQTRRGRTQLATQALGPVGMLFGSPATARVLEVFTSAPNTRLTLGGVIQRTGGAKATVQTALRTLIAAELVRREGQGAATTYTYATDRELAKGVLTVVRLSRQCDSMADAPLPWLTRLIRETPSAGVQQPFGERRERMPSEDGAANVLAANPPIPEAAAQRSRPGLIARR